MCKDANEDFYGAVKIMKSIAVKAIYINVIFFIQ